MSGNLLTYVSVLAVAVLAIRAAKYAAREWRTDATLRRWIVLGD